MPFARRSGQEAAAARKKRSRFLGGAEEDFADEGLRGGGQDHCDGVGYVGGLEHFATVFLA